MTAASQRNAGIYALRGVSILLVLIHHLALRIPLRDTRLWLRGQSADKPISMSAD